MRSTHTPGPWHNHDGMIVHRMGDIARMESTNPDDAYLVAAAPALLAALEAADKWVAMYHDQPGHDAASRAMSAVIRAALARAKGQA